MKKVDKDSVLVFIYFILIMMFIALIITCIVIRIYVVKEYGNMPITEVPSWAIPWLLSE